MRSTSLTHWVLVLALSLAALPRAAAAGAGGRDPQSPETADQQPLKVSFKPLFDVHTHFKTKKTVKLRFQAREAATGKPIPKDKIIFSMHHPPEKTIDQLTPRVVKPGVFELPFTPAEPGRYVIQVLVRGARLGEIPPLQLGVVGLADGLVEVPASEDAEVQRQARQHGAKPTPR